MWKYTLKDGWTLTDDILAKHYKAANNDLNIAMEKAGYEPAQLQYGAYGFLVHVHTVKAGLAHPYPYLVWVTVGGRSEAPYVGIAPAQGWMAGGNRVAAFGMTADGTAIPLVATNNPYEAGLQPSTGRLTYEPD
jgi:hypothetical protein